jgi:hypothetical protein
LSYCTRCLNRLDGYDAYSVAIAAGVWFEEAATARKVAQETGKRRQPLRRLRISEKEVGRGKNKGYPYLQTQNKPIERTVICARGRRWLRKPPAGTGDVQKEHGSDGRNSTPLY